MNGVRKIEQSVFNGEVDQGSGTAIHTGRRRSMYLHPGSGPQNGKGQNGLPGNSRVEEDSGILWPILHQRQMMTPITDWHMRGSRKSMTTMNFRSEIRNESEVEL